MISAVVIEMDIFEQTFNEQNLLIVRSDIYLLNSIKFDLKILSAGNRNASNDKVQAKYAYYRFRKMYLLQVRFAWNSYTDNTVHRVFGERIETNTKWGTYIGGS